MASWKGGDEGFLRKLVKKLIWMFPKNRGIPKMDGENNGKPY